MHETGRHFEIFFFVCVNVENRLRCSTRTKIDLGRGCLIRVGGRGFCYTRKIRHSQITLCACRRLVMLFNSN